MVLFGFFPLLCLIFLPAPSLSGEVDGNDDTSDIIPDYSKIRMPSAKTFTCLEDVNTKLYIGTEVKKKFPSVKINNIKSYFILVRLLNDLHAFNIFSTY